MRFGILVSALALAACGSADGSEQPGIQAYSGDGNSRHYKVDGFERLALEGHQDVIVRTGAVASVRAEGDPDVLDQLDISVRNGTLVVGKKKKGWNPGSRPAAKIFITMPDITGASIGGSGKLDIDKVETDAFEGSISGSGDIRIQSLRVRNAEFAVAGSGDIEATGAADRLDLNIAGSGDLKLDKVESQSLSVSIAGSGNVRARASGTADVSILGAGDVMVSGPAKCSVSKLGSGNVRCNA